MPSPYDLIQRAKQQRKKEEGNKRADRWATLQVNTAQDIKPVAKAEEAAFGKLPTEGRVFVSVANRDKRTLIFPIQRLSSLGFTLLATAGTAAMLRRNGIECETVLKASDVRDGAEGQSIVDLILDGDVDLILNTPAGSAGARHDGYDIRAAAVTSSVPLVTTVQGITAAVQGIEALRDGELTVRALQELDHTAGQ